MVAYCPLSETGVSTCEISLAALVTGEPARSTSRRPHPLRTDGRHDPVRCTGRLGVIGGSGYGYLRDDGVQVIPITALGP